MVIGFSFFEILDFSYGMIIIVCGRGNIYGIDLGYQESDQSLGMVFRIYGFINLEEFYLKISRVVVFMNYSSML